HDFKFGFEDLYDFYRLGINGTSGPYRLSWASFSAAAPSRIRFADVGAPSDYGSGWSVSANIDQHYSGYAQDRWTPNNRLTITAGARHGHQDPPHRPARGKPPHHTVAHAMHARD